MDLGPRGSDHGVRCPLTLESATTGDLNFVPMVTASLPQTKNLVSNYNLLSPSPQGTDVEQTSS